MTDTLSFVRLSDVEPADIAAHMSDPKVAEHMPLLKGKWDTAAAAEFVEMKEAFWAKDGLGHWAFLLGDRYVGWGGFQKESNEWDFGLVLRSDAFGLGNRIFRKALIFAQGDERIPYITFLLPPSRKKVSALKRLGAQHVGRVEHDGETFVKYRLETNAPPDVAVQKAR